MNRCYRQNISTHDMIFRWFEYVRVCERVFVCTCLCVCLGGQTKRTVLKKDIHYLIIDSWFSLKSDDGSLHFKYTIISGVWSWCTVSNEMLSNGMCERSHIKLTPSVFSFQKANTSMTNHRTVSCFSFFISPHIWGFCTINLLNLCWCEKKTQYVFIPIQKIMRDHNTFGGFRNGFFHNK